MSKMSQKVLILLCLVSFINFGYSNSVPFITKCTAADSKCIKKSAQTALPIFAKGIPELGVETLDPVTITKTIDASTSGLKLLIDDFKVEGLKDCVLKKLQRDVQKSKLSGKLLCTVTNEGQYEMDGQLLIVKVQGKGKIVVVLRKILISLEADVSEKVKDGKKYWDIKRFSHSFELQDKAEVKFENLNTGNDIIGRAANDVITNSSNEIVLEVGPPVIQAIVTKVMENIRHFFNNVPSEDLALD